MAAAAGEGVALASADMEAFYRSANYPLVKSFSDMDQDQREEIVDICSTAVEKHPDLDKCTQAIKDALDAKFGSPWHAVAGPYFSYDITQENMLFMFVGGKVGVLVWKM